MQVSKISASGNDFVIFHTFKEKNRSDLARKICHRQEGIGADGLIVLLPHKEYDFQWEFYNSDGSEAFMCGNGSRACALYAFTNKLANSKMSFLTKAGVIEANVEDNIVETKLTKPVLIRDKFEEEGMSWKLIDTGVPHLVSFTDNLDEFDLSLARKLREKYNANVNFAMLKDDIFVRTFERGVEGETLACGTGMAACFYSAFKDSKVANKVSVFPKSKEKLELRFQDNDMFLKGEVRHIFDTTWKKN